MNDGELAATIVVSLAVFFILFFGVLLYVTRRNRRGSATTSAVRQRIQRMNNNSNNPAAGPVEADEAGFTEQEQQEHGLEDVQVDEFGQSTARRHSRQASNSSFHDHVDGAADGGEPQTWLSSTTSSGTKSYLGGWFGLDSPNLGSQEDRGTRDQRIAEISASMRKHQRTRVKSEDDSDDDDTVRGVNTRENELGETEAEEENRLAG